MLERKTKFYKSGNKIILSCFLTLSFFAAAGLNVHASEITAEAMIKLTNQSRTESGAEILSVNSKLARAAYLKASDMLEFDYFDHASPSGVDPWHWIGLVNYDYRYAGENLAIDFATAEGVHRALMESSSHRDNILNPRFKEMGVAVLDGEFEGSNSIVVVEMFASPFYADNGEVKNEKIESELKPELKLRPEPESKFEPELKLELELKPKLESNPAALPLSAPEPEIADIPKDISKEKEPASKLAAPEPAIKKELNLLAMILAEENSDLVGGYLASDLYFKDNNEIFKGRKEGAVLASAAVRREHSKNGSAVYLLPLILGADLLFSLLIFKSGEI